MDFPKMIYYKGGVYTICQTQEDYNCLKDHFSDTPIDGAKINMVPEIAKRLIKEAKKEVKKQVEEKPEKVDIKDMQWSKLKSYAKELGVKLPLGAKRDQIEKAINGVLNGNDKRPNKS